MTLIEASALDSTQVWLAALALVFCAEVVYVTLGFGAGMIALGGLALLMGDPRDAVVVLMLITAPVQVWVLWKQFAGKPKLMYPRLAAGVALGVPLGTYVLKHFGARELLLALGCVLIGAATVFFFQPKRARTSHRASEPWVGFVSGALSGAFGAGGSPLILYFQWVGLPRADFRAAMMSMFLVSSVMRVPAYGAAGLFNAPRFLAALLLAPAVVAGIAVGQKLHVGLNEGTFRRVVLVGLASIGVFLVTRHVFG